MYKNEINEGPMILTRSAALQKPNGSTKFKYKTQWSAERTNSPVDLIRYHAINIIHTKSHK